MGGGWEVEGGYVRFACDSRYGASGMSGQLSTLAMDLYLFLSSACPCRGDVEVVFSSVKLWHIKNVTMQKAFSETRLY
jgi:hypothetical protein